MLPIFAVMPDRVRDHSFPRCHLSTPLSVAGDADSPAANSPAMAYRRKHQTPKASTFAVFDSPSSSPRAGSPLAPNHAARPSSSSFSGESSCRSPDGLGRATTSAFSTTDSYPTYEYTSMKILDENKNGFWDALARKAKSIVEDDNAAKMRESPKRTPISQTIVTSTGDLFQQSLQSPEGINKAESPRFQRGIEAITSSLNHIGETIGNAFEEGRTIVGSKTADIISETKKFQIRKRGENGSATTTIHQATVIDSIGQHQPVSQTIQVDQDTQLKASRDVAIAMAAKAKLFLRELKTVKADLAFAKQRCTQLEEVNKILRESCEKGDNPEDDELVRLQLETLLAEKSRLAHENSIYARENRFLREIVDYHQLTMQDIVYVDEGYEEVAEVYPSGVSSAHVDVHTVIATPELDLEVTSPASCSTGPSSPVPSNVHRQLASSLSPVTRKIVSPVEHVLSSSDSKAEEEDLKQQNSNNNTA